MFSSGTERKEKDIFAKENIQKNYCTANKGPGAEACC
jgi:hypothetical protein